MGVVSRWRADMRAANEIDTRRRAGDQERRARRDVPLPAGVVLGRAAWRDQPRLVVALRPVAPGTVELLDEPGGAPRPVHVTGVTVEGPSTLRLALADGRSMTFHALAEGEQSMADVGHQQPTNPLRDGATDPVSAVVWVGYATWRAVCWPFRAPGAAARRGDRARRAEQLRAALVG